MLSNYHNYPIGQNNLTWGIMIKGNNDISFAGDDALKYLDGSMHKKYSMTFIWGHPFDMCEYYERFLYLSHIPPSAHMNAFIVPYPRYVILSIWYNPLLFWLCSFAIVPSYCFTSITQEFWLTLSNL